MAQREPKHVAGSNNVKYTINPNNHWVALDYIFCNLYTYVTEKSLLFRDCRTIGRNKITIISSYPEKDVLVRGGGDDKNGNSFGT